MLIDCRSVRSSRHTPCAVRHIFLRFSGRHTECACYFAAAAGLAAGLLLAPGLRAAEPSRPNILWLVSEDNDTFLGCYGDPLARTPTLDKLAREGVLYERCFAEPVCAPSRFTLITRDVCGHLRPGRAHAGAGQDSRVAARVSRRYLREAGYYTSNNAKTDYNSPISIKEAWDAVRQARPTGASAPPRQPFFSVFNHEVTHESCLFPDKELPLAFPPTDPAKVRIPPYQPDTPEMRADWARYYNHMTAAGRPDRREAQGPGRRRPGR